MTEFAVVVVYDISDDKLRKIVEKTCKSFGLSHVQRSAFVGFLEESARRSLYTELQNIIEMTNYEGEVSIRIYRMQKKDYAQKLSIGHLSGFDPDPEAIDTMVI